MIFLLNRRSKERQKGEFMSDLSRFLEAQENVYETALEEIKSGRKKSHWIWYIFPQIAGLGASTKTWQYSIKDITEAREYLKHPILGTRLREITEALLPLPGNNPTEVMGPPDDLKLRSSMTLFYEASRDIIFKRVLDKYYEGEPDPLTLVILKKITKESGDTPFVSNELCQGCAYYYAEPGWCMDGENHAPKNAPRKCEEETESKQGGAT